MAVRCSSSISPLASKSTRLFDSRGSVFSEFTGLSNAKGAVNLGQGFPTVPLSAFVVDSLMKAAQNGVLTHQYTRSEGHPRLVQALAKYYESLIGRTIDAKSEITVANGATEAIYATITAFVDPGDEVIIFQPMYDSYKASVVLSGGVPVYCTLRPTSQPTGALTADDFKLDFKEFESKITSKTKMVIVNNPNNPLGKVFSREELAEIAGIVSKHDNLLVLADEVYETLVYSPVEFTKFSTLPGMWERTISIGSFGKTFGATGWKLGWCIAPAEIIRPIWMIRQWISFAVATPLQEAAADCFQIAEQEDFFALNRLVYQNLRDKLSGILRETGFDPIVPSAGYFTCADTTSVTSSIPANYDHPEADYRVCQYLTSEVGVGPIPVSAFYSEGRPAGNMSRFAFCKSQQMLQEGGARLKEWRKKVKAQVQ